MACALQSGYQISQCGPSVGGVDVVYLIETANLYDASGVSRVIDVSGTVTGLTKAPGTKFFKFEVPRATASTTSGGTGSQENGTYFYTHGLTMPLNRRDATTRNLIAVLAKNQLTAVVKEKDGVYRMYGKDSGLSLDSGEGGSGTAGGDRNGYLLTFTAIEKEDFLVVAPAVAAALEIAGT